ncbi:MAG TPA: cytochrome C oxidase subunit IV family protein [Gemmatimonadales bacterium]|nr:cytochrome C oxidase subunit IV family protein [Gemmatimonadales bacterium]
MDATAHAPGAADTGHAHPTWKVYTRVAIILFVLTALEVACYEVAHRHSPAGLATVLEPMVVEVLLVLSAFKFALVAMFYMHLKSDGKLLSSIFSFSLLLAALVITALMLLFSYLYQLHPTANPLK